MRLLPAVVVVLVLAFIPSAEAATAKCHPAGSKRIFSTSTVRVFTLKRSGDTYTYACSSGRFAFRLPFSEFPSEDVYTRFRVRGNYITYAVRLSCAACEESATEVLVHDLRTGRAVVHDTALAAGEEDSRVDALLLTTAGTAVWIGSGPTYTPTRTRVLLRRRGERRATVLADDAGIDRTSLALRGSTVEWTAHGIRASAPLAPGQTGV